MAHVHLNESCTVLTPHLKQRCLLYGAAAAAAAAATDAQTFCSRLQELGALTKRGMQPSRGLVSIVVPGICPWPSLSLWAMKILDHLDHR